ncbi:MAG: hypothetical protein ACYC1Q_01520 [Bacteroidia bacterium]
MTRLDELIRKAGQISPPLDMDEIKTIIDGAAAKSGRKKRGGKISVFFFILCSGVLVAALAIWPFKEKQSVQDTEKVQVEQSASGLGSLQEERDEAPTREEDPDHQPGNARVTAKSEEVFSPSVTETSGTPEIHHGAPIQLTESQLTPDEKEGSVPTPVAPDLVQVDDKPLVQDTTLSVEPNKKNKEEKIAEAPHFRRNYIRTDLYGYVTGLVVTAQIKNMDGVDFSPYTGTRLSLGYERMFHKRLSLDLVANYGFREEMIFAGISSPAPEAACYINYKGSVFHLGARFYPIARPNGSGLFIGPYASFGFLKERYIGYESYGPGTGTFTTLGVNKGKSFGYGAYLGGKLVVGRFFGELSLGMIFRGRDYGYSTSIMDREPHERYPNLNRYLELSFGYSF